MTVSLIYMTAASHDEAEKIGTALVEERLAACANILGEMTSIYRWKGAVQQEPEVAMIVKTQSERVDDVISRIEQLHSYDTPCAIEIAIGRGTGKFLNWIVEETS